MRALYISQTNQLTKGWKYSRVTLILAVCFMSLFVSLILLNDSKLPRFEPFHSTANPLKENASNMSANLLGGTSQDTAPLASDGKNSSSKPSNTRNKPISEQHKVNDELIALGFGKKIMHKQIPILLSIPYKNKHYKPSSYLIAKLRNYEEIRTRCGPRSLSYRKTIRKLSRTRYIHDNETTLCKYLVWRPANGLGNRMISMVSAFLYSILENRVFLVEFEDDMDGLFCEPFPNSTWVLPKNFPHKNNWSQLPTFKNRGNSGESGFSPSFVHLDIQHVLGDHNICHFHCNETLVYLQKISVLILISEQYFVPSLFMSSSYKEELNKMFQQKVAVFHHLGCYLFSPSNQVWGLITRFYEAYLAKADEKIGLQIRVFDHQHVLSQNIMSQILSCTQSNNILPSLDNTQDSLEFPWKNSTSKSKAILVVSLYPEYAEKLKSMYWTRPTTNGDVIGVYQPSHEEYQKFGDKRHNMKALAEIYLLSLCDVLVTSPQSTFGYVAQSLGGLKPWIMVNLGKNNHPNMPCKRGFSMDPCFHVRPQYDCKDKNKISNFTNIYPYIKTCDDLLLGIKLVDF